jgi:hypothetical protein
MKFFVAVRPLSNDTPTPTLTDDNEHFVDADPCTRAAACRSVERRARVEQELVKR